MAASVSGSRSRHGSKSTRSPRSHTAVRRRTTTKPREDEVAPKPDLDELRRKRLQYLSVSPEAHRRASTGSTVKTRLRDDASATKTSSSDEHRRRRRRHRSSSSKADGSSDARRSADDGYVYATSRTSSSSKRDKDGDKSRSDPERRSKTSSSSRRHSLPTVIEKELSPEDSVSQIGIRQDRRSSKTSSSLRPSLWRRSTTTPVKLPTISEKENETKSTTTSAKRSSKRDPTPSLLGTLLRRNTEPAVPTAPRLIECLTCASDDVPRANSAKLACGHRMCHDCLKRVFEMSVKDPAHMPPKCCTADHIPLKHVDKLFDLKFKMTWNRKYQEYNTKNRIYCPAAKCGEWIKPSHIHTSQGRKYAQCPKCQTKVCTLCNGKLHKSKDCPKDPEIAKLVEQAKEKGWMSCFNCKAMVELKEGCNHMTCRCLAEFCMVCGAKWKTCDCPWFNYRQLPDADRLNDWRVPEPIQNIYRRAFGVPPDPAQGAPPPGPQPPAGAQPDERTENRRQRTYLQELEDRRRQEREDANLARRMQLATLLEPGEEPQGRQRANLEAWGLGNAAGHFLNDDFVQNAANVVMSAFGDANMGRRGERASGRQRRAREAQRTDPGLVPNFLGDESVVGAGRATPRARPAP